MSFHKYTLKLSNLFWNKGLAQVQGMCSLTGSCTLSKDGGLGTAYTIAHETGHKWDFIDLCGSQSFCIVVHVVWSFPALLSPTTMNDCNLFCRAILSFTISNFFEQWIFLSVCFCLQSLGAQHDGAGNACVNGKNLMATQASGKQTAFEWSSCSRHTINAFLS